MTRPAIIPAGSWPRRMGVELAAAYCGEPTIEAFMSRVGTARPCGICSKNERAASTRPFSTVSVHRAIMPRSKSRAVFGIRIACTTKRYSAPVSAGRGQRFCPNKIDTVDEI
jgi:hypothetical protein